MPSVAFATLGCKVNQSETEAIEGLFKKRGYTVVPFDAKADFYVINTCSVTHLGERKSRQFIRRAIKLNPKAIVAVTGCYAQVAPEQVEAIPGVKVLVGTKDRYKIVELMEDAAGKDGVVNGVADVMAAKEFEEIPLFEFRGRTRAFLKIQEGCANFCTYCIIPYARGPLRSRKLNHIKDEAQKLADAGFQEIVLTGIHLGAYGRDLAGTVTLADAAREVLSIKSLARLRLGSLESIEVSDDLLDLFAADKRLCPHLHLPLQAGHNAVLKAMNRHYTIEEYKLLIGRIGEKIPGLAVSTDIIVGFPGESDEQFEESLAFVESVEFARIHVFPYSKREGTPAAAFEDQISELVKKERARQMQNLANEKALNFRRRWIGKTLPVLLEKKNGRVAEGLTANYMRVYADAPAAQCNRIYDFVIEKEYEDGLWGKICK